MYIWFGVPAAVLAVSYVGICVEAGAIWPGRALVHESGLRTLAQTVFWFEHGVREIPIDLLLGASVAGSVLRYDAHDAVDRPGRRHWMIWTGALTMVLVIVVVTGAAISSGGAVVLEELAQMHTRPGAPASWGRHWDTHLLSRFALLLLALPAVNVQAVLAGPSARHHRSDIGRLLYGSAIGTFLLATVFFGPNADPFRDGVHIGHQARELFTHALVTLPLSLGIGLLVCQRIGRPATMRADDTRDAVSRASWVAGAGAAAIGIYLTVGFLATAAYGRGQTSNLVALVLVHFFEHALTFAFTALWTGFLCAWLMARSGRESDG